MKRIYFEAYIGKCVEIRFFDGDVLKGYLWKTGMERFEADPSLYIPRNRYFVTRDSEARDFAGCLFRVSHVKSIRGI